MHGEGGVDGHVVLPDSQLPFFRPKVSSSFRRRAAEIDSVSPSRLP